VRGIKLSSFDILIGSIPNTWCTCLGDLSKPGTGLGVWVNADTLIALVLNTASDLSKPNILIRKVLMFDFKKISMSHDPDSTRSHPSKGSTR
jgi:hypothetical protein